MMAIAVESSTIAIIAYDHARLLLKVRFRDGSVYLYSGVPADLYATLLSAPSKGTFFNSAIRNRFTCTRASDTSG